MLRKVGFKHIHIFIAAITIMLFSILTGCTQGQSINDSNDKKGNVSTSIDKIVSSAQEGSKSTASSNGVLKVHYIDVGQADSILIENNNSFTLIDTGTNEAASTVVGYLKNHGVKKIDNLVLTHPHEDHIGGADNVIRDFDIGKVYMPKVTANTKTFKDVVSAMQSKGLKATTPVVGSTFKIGDATATILSPNSNSYKDLNNYSIAIRVVYGSTSFLFMGDAQAPSEKEILSKGFDIKSDVLKVGHHGSYSSTTQEFLNAVNPKYAVISVGKNNDYGHPHRETLDKLNAKGIKIFRTDENGTIVATSNGKSIEFNTEKGSSDNSSKTTQTQVSQTNQANTSGVSKNTYVDANGRGLIKGNINSKGEKIYHMPGQAYYDKTNPEQWFKTEAEAQAAGFRKSQR